MALPLAIIALAASLYLLVAIRQPSLGSTGWSWWRIFSFVSGCIALAWSLLPQFLPFPEGDFRQHMVQHFLMGMLAPLGLVMAAPVTLILRTVPASWGRVITSILQSGPVEVLANPFVALTLNVGGMAALYFTPLYMEMMTRPAFHYFIHFHFVAAGCLYTWVIAGPDPAPYRPSVPARLVVLGIAVVAHSVMAQLLYAGLFVPFMVLPDHLKQAAIIMYYGGDITEMLLAVALVSTWRPARRKNVKSVSMRLLNFLGKSEKASVSSPIAFHRAESSV